MPRTLKPQPVGDPVQDSILGASVQIFLDRNKLDFFATIGDVTIRNKEADALRREVEGKLRDARSLTWIPIIEVDSIKTFARDTSHTLGFNFERYWIARKGDGNFLVANWPNDTDDARLKMSKSFWIGRAKPSGDIIFPWRVDSLTTGGPRTLLAYSKEVWDGLGRIQAAVNEARRRLDALLETPEGVAQLASFGVPQLTAGYGTSPAGGVYAKYIKAGIPTSADLMELEEGEVCPDCKRPFKAADVVDFEDYLESDDYCQTCGMLFYEYEPRPTPPPDPDKAVELSSWDYRALKLIQDRRADITEGEWAGIAHLATDLTARGLIVFDAARVPFLTPKGFNSLCEADPQKDSNPPLEISIERGWPTLRPVQPPVQITRRVASRGQTAPQEIVGAGETEQGQPFYLMRPRASDDADDQPPYDSPFAHHPHCPKRWGGVACLCNALDTNDALE